MGGMRDSGGGRREDGRVRERKREVVGGVKRVNLDIFGWCWPVWPTIDRRSILQTTIDFGRK